MPKHYLVTGRMCFDDEDTHCVYGLGSREEAVSAFVEEMWEIHLGSFTEPPSPEYRHNKVEAGEGVFINGVYESETEIKEAPRA